MRRRTVPSSPYRNHASLPGSYILRRHIYVHRVSHGWTSRTSAAVGEVRGDREIDPRRDPTAWTILLAFEARGERNVTRIDTGIVRVLQPRWIWPITRRSRFWHAFGTWTCRWFCPMYRRSPLFQRSFRIMLNNGTNAIVSAERDHVQITMIRRYREPPTRTPRVLSYLRPFAWTVALVLFRFSYLQLPIFSSPSSSFSFIRPFQSRERSFIRYASKLYNLNNCFSWREYVKFPFSILSQHCARVWKGDEVEKAYDRRWIRRCRVIIREKRISRLSRDEGRRERKGTRVRVRNTYAEDIPSAEKRGKSRVNPLIMSQIRGTRFAENDSDVREICKSRRVERGALVRFIFWSVVPVSSPATATFRLKFTNVCRGRWLLADLLSTRREREEAFAPIRVTRTRVIADGC